MKGLATDAEVVEYRVAEGRDLVALGLLGVCEL